MKVHHIGYLVKEIQKSIPAFEALGYQVDDRFPVDFWDASRMAHFAFLRCGGYCIELIAPAKESPLYALYRQYKCAPYHMCYLCEGLEETIERLKEKGFMLFLAPAPAPAIGETANVAFLISARAGMVELLEEKK